MFLKRDFRQSVQSAWAHIPRGNTLLVLSFVVIAMIASLLTAYLASSREFAVAGAEAVFATRDFSRTPFSLMDAYDACLMESKSKFGDNLLRSHMLPLSTRYNESTQEYLVVLSADVGAINDWNEATIYCSIDPVAQQISYYKEVHDGELSILSKTMSLLSSALR